MVFSTSSRNIRLEHDAKTDLTYLHAECQTDFGDYNDYSICLDEHLGVSQEHIPAFDTSKDKTAKALGKTLQSSVDPGTLSLRGTSVLYGRVSSEDHVHELIFYLDLLLNNDDGCLDVHAGSTSLLKTAASIKINERGEMTALLLTPNGKLAASGFSLRGDCEYDDGRLKPLPGNVMNWYVRNCSLDYKGIKGEWSHQWEGGDWQKWQVSFEDQLSNANGVMSAEDPNERVDKTYPVSCHKQLQKELANLALNMAGVEALQNEASRATAQCVYSSIVATGFLVSNIVFGRAALGYAPALAFIAGSVVQSATGPFVGNPEMRDELAAIAMFRTLKNELSTATGISFNELGLLADVESFSAPAFDFDYIEDLQTYSMELFTKQGIDSSILDDMKYQWQNIGWTAMKILMNRTSEDSLKHEFDDHDHDGVDLLPPPPLPSPGPDKKPPPEKKKDDEGDYIGEWTKNMVDIQDQLYLLEPSVGADVEQSTKNALEAIANGLTGLNDLLDYWPDYKGDDATNEKRIQIIQSAIDLVEKGSKTVKGTEEDNSVLDQVTALDEKLVSLTSQFTKEATDEQAELDKLKSELQPAVERMFADQKIYQSAQNELLAALKKISDEERKHGGEATIEGGIRWYKDLMARRTSALEPFQKAADIANTTYLQSEQTVVHLQTCQATLNDIHKRRYAVYRESAKAEMIVRALKMMIEGTKREEKRILSVVDLMSVTLDNLLHIGEPPYHRENRRVEDDLCNAVLAVHRESLVDASLVESARKAVTKVQAWFGDDMPKATQQEIDAIEKNPLYQPS